MLPPKVEMKMVTYTINEEKEEFVAGDLEVRANGQDIEVHLREFFPLVGFCHYDQRVESLGDDYDKNAGFGDSLYLLLQAAYHLTFIIAPIVGVIEHFKSKLP